MVTNTFQFVKDRIFELRRKLRVLVLVSYDLLWAIRVYRFVCHNLCCFNWSREHIVFIGWETIYQGKIPGWIVLLREIFICKQVGLWENNWKTQFVAACITTRFADVILKRAGNNSIWFFTITAEIIARSLANFYCQ